MALIKGQLGAGELQGLKLGDGTRLCHQLFADDTGLFLSDTESEFLSARDIIQLYKNISGVLLNVQKSKIIPLYLTDGKYLDWMERSGCSIARAGEITECLGIGYKLNLSGNRLGL